MYYTYKEKKKKETKNVGKIDGIIYKRNRENQGQGQVAKVKILCCDIM